ncbi:hypothetical protein Patl1_06467 [Pistacia atlantica]|uniref:Uncharacterized protein n=1 Tax=Pistacia atlantica TaxID=434234 RepID=A0ACC1BU87_9ROSI|nr:hypothetical protein Patl1_06467 [Pistacia atlantica]
MQTEARMGVVVEGGQRGLSSGHGSVSVDKLSKQKQQMLQNHSQIGTMSHLLAGGVAGALSKTCTAPLARLTILFQVQGMHSDGAALRKASIWREASRIVNEEGFRAFWKGNLVTIAHRLPYSSVNFYAYEQYKKLLQVIPGLQSRGENMGADACLHFLGGGLAGITAASATYPLDLVRTRLAAQTNVIYYRGIWHALQTICREEGVLGLYKGLGATLLGVGPSIAISFSVYETLRSFWQLQRPRDSTVLVSLACGSLSGIASSTDLVWINCITNISSITCVPKHCSWFHHGVVVLFSAAIERHCSRSHQLLSLQFTYLPQTTFPLDLVRRRKQLEGVGGRARVYTTGLFGIFRQIIQTEGFRGMYRGILPEYYKVVPGVGICFMTYETLKMLLADVSTSL